LVKQTSNVILGTLFEQLCYFTEKTNNIIISSIYHKSECFSSEITALFFRFSTYNQVILVSTVAKYQKCLIIHERYVIDLLYEFNVIAFSVSYMRQNNTEPLET
jgi:hypothetical protein